MKALTMTLLAALALMASVSNAKMIQLECGRWITDNSVRRDNTSTVVKTANSTKRTGSNSQTGDVPSIN